MERINANPDLWDTIHRYTEGRLKGKELEEFQRLLATDEEIAEMVAFSRSLDIDDTLRDPELTPFEKERIIEGVKGDPLLEEELRLNREMGFVAKNRNLLGVVYAVQALTEGLSPTSDPPGETVRPKPDSAKGAWAGKFPKIVLLAASGLTALLVIGLAASLWNLLSKDTSFPDIPDYPYIFLEDKSAVETLYDKKDYEPAMEELKRIKEETINSGFYDQITINRYEFYIAICQMRLGDLDSARIGLEALVNDELELAGNPEALFLGLVYFKTDNFPKAKEWLTRAAKSDGYLKDGILISEVADLYLKKLEKFM